MQHALYEAARRMGRLPPRSGACCSNGRTEPPNEKSRVTQTSWRSVRAAFKKIARRIVMGSSGDVYRAFGYLSGLEPGPVVPTPLTESSSLRSTHYPYRTATTPSEALEYSYDKIGETRAAKPSSLSPVTRD
jgi:hypothetical protein